MKKNLDYYINQKIKCENKREKAKNDYLNLLKERARLFAINQLKEGRENYYKLKYFTREYLQSEKNFDIAFENYLTALNER